MCDVEVASWKRFWKSEDGGPRCCQDCGTGKRGGEKILAVLGGRMSFTATYRELKGLIGRVHPPLLAHLHPPSPICPGSPVQFVNSISSTFQSMAPPPSFSLAISCQLFSWEQSSQHDNNIDGRAKMSFEVQESSDITSLPTHCSI